MRMDSAGESKASASRVRLYSAHGQGGITHAYRYISAVIYWSLTRAEGGLSASLSA